MRWWKRNQDAQTGGPGSTPRTRPPRGAEPPRTTWERCLRNAKTSGEDQDINNQPFVSNGSVGPTHRQRDSSPRTAPVPSDPRSSALAQLPGGSPPAGPYRKDRDVSDGESSGPVGGHAGTPQLTPRMGLGKRRRRRSLQPRTHHL